MPIATQTLVNLIIKIVDMVGYTIKIVPKNNFITKIKSHNRLSCNTLWPDMCP